MNKNNFLIIAFLVLIIAIITLVMIRKIAERKSVGYLTIGNTKLSVEIAKTPAEREKGLSGRKSLCSDCGLLFIFPEKQRYAFWMKQMYFDIDIVWIDGDKVVDITHNAAKPPAAEFNIPKQVYRPKIPVDKVLEVNAGWAARKGIKIGDAISPII